MERLKILFVYENEFIPEKGGIRRVTDVLTREFIKRGHNVSYLVFRRTPEGYNYDYPAENIYFPDGYEDTEKNKIFFRNLLRDKDIDIVIYQNHLMSKIYLPLNEYESKGRPLFLNVIHTSPTLGLKYLHRSYFSINEISFRSILRFGWHIINYRSYKNKRAKSLRERLEYDIANSDKTILLSKYFIPTLKKQYNSSWNSRYISIPNPLCLPSNNDEVENKKRNILLYVGRLVNEVKQTNLIIRIWNDLAPKYPDWTLKIAGDGPDRNVLESQCKYKNQTVFLGFTKPEELYDEAKILLMASLYEGWPLVIPEAMNSGVIPILFDSFESAQEIINDSVNGILVPPFDIDEFKKKLQELMSNENERKLISKNAIRSSKQYLVENICDIWEKIFLIGMSRKG